VFILASLVGMARRMFLNRDTAGGAVLGELCRAVALVAGPSTGSVNPLMRSYTLWVAWWAGQVLWSGVIVLCPSGWVMR